MKTSRAQEREPERRRENESKSKTDGAQHKPSTLNKRSRSGARTLEPSSATSLRRIFRRPISSEESSTRPSRLNFHVIDPSLRCAKRGRERGEERGRGRGRGREGEMNKPRASITVT
eukprot:981376-Rhodomonas_salina.1